MEHPKNDFSGGWPLGNPPLRGSVDGLLAITGFRLFTTSPNSVFILKNSRPLWIILLDEFTGRIIPGDVCDGMGFDIRLPFGEFEKFHR